MPKTNRLESATSVYHFINRGINKRNLFHSVSDFRTYYDILHKLRDSLRLEIYHYCLMTNHTHLMLKAEAKETVSLFAHSLHTSYAFQYKKNYRHEGVVFHKDSKHLPIEKEAYFLECGRYIERNPLKAGMVSRPEDYPWSSYLFYAEGKKDDLVTPSPFYAGLHNSPMLRRHAYASYVSISRPQEEMPQHLQKSPKKIKKGSPLLALKGVTPFQEVR